MTVDAVAQAPPVAPRELTMFSQTLISGEAWRNPAIARLKAELGKEIGLLASTRLAQSALAAGVVDELALLVIPELFGHGTRLFEGHALRRNLKLIEARVMDTGAVQMRYAVTPKLSGGRG